MKKINHWIGPATKAFNFKPFKIYRSFDFAYLFLCPPDLDLWNDPRILAVIAEGPKREGIPA